METKDGKFWQMCTTSRMPVEVYLVLEKTDRTDMLTRTGAKSRKIEDEMSRVTGMSFIYEAGCASN